MTGMQAEAGYACPITMTFAVVPALRAQPELAAEWEPLVTATTYDPRSIPAAEKGSAIAGMAMTEKQGGSDVRANTTYARPLNGGGAGAEYRAHRPQVVLLGADVRHLPRARPGRVARRRRRGPVLLSDAAHPARRHAQRDAHPAPEGQARQPLQRLLGDRAARRLGADGGRARPRRADDHRDGRPHAPRLRDRRRRRDARRGRAGHPPRRAPRRVRQDADRPAVDAERARRPVPGVRGLHGARDAPRARLRRSLASDAAAKATTTATPSCSSASRPRSASTGPASARRTTRSRRWSASGAMATSRSPGCRACTARRRSPRSGRARAT